MKKNLLLILLLFGLSPFLRAENYRISLLTCDPGEELYSAFGHSAIRIVEESSGRDLVYNYGTFDFNTPFFYVKFAQRTLDYMLSLTTYERFMAEYQYFRRSVREQVLDLNPDQTRALLAALELNYRPDNRYYRYDFFYDNCATRIRDIVEEVLGKQLIWAKPPEDKPQTFRQLIDEYVEERMPWADFGIDLALGSVIDAQASAYEKQFLPDYMERAFSHARIEGDGPTRPLVKSSSILLDFERPAPSFSPLNPYLLGWIFGIGMILLTYVGFKKQKLYFQADVVYWSLLGLCGLVILALWFLTYHSQTKWNWNLFWTFPGHLLLLPLLFKKQLDRLWRRYFLTVLILADIAIIWWIFGWQSFHPAIIPLVLVLILRSNFLYYNWEKFRALQSSKRSS
ncbi:MAG: Lnb N-terminal periplasmic domain-containing protein [Nitritalea sp.]